MNQVRNHQLSYAISRPTPNVGGKINPRFIVMHYTAGDTAASAIATFQNPNSRVSAHVTIDVDGKIYQHAPFNVRTWHAGPSEHMGYSGLNAHSIGIELVNVGWMRDSNGRWFRAPFSAPKSAKGIVARNARAGSGDFFWPEYPEAQLKAAEDLSKDLVASYQILDIVTHEQIDTRGWKTDPGPAFPMERYKRLLFAAPHRDLDVDTYQVTASTLNVRFGPAASFKIAATLRRGDIVKVIASHGDWRRIDIRGNDDGWVNAAFLRRI